MPLKRIAPHVEGREEEEPDPGPAGPQPRNEEPQAEAQEPENEDSPGDAHGGAAVFVEGGVEEEQVAEGRCEHPESDPAPRTPVFALGDGDEIEPQRAEGDRRDAKVVEGARQEDGEPFTRREIDVARLLVEEQRDAQHEADGEGQSRQPPVAVRQQTERVFHG